VANPYQPGPAPMPAAPPPGYGWPAQPGAPVGQANPLHSAPRAAGGRSTSTLVAAGLILLSFVIQFIGRFVRYGDFSWMGHPIVITWIVTLGVSIAGAVQLILNRNPVSARITAAIAASWLFIIQLSDITNGLGYYAYGVLRSGIWSAIPGALVALAAIVLLYISSRGTAAKPGLAPAMPWPSTQASWPQQQQTPYGQQPAGFPAQVPGFPQQHPSAAPQHGGFPQQQPAAPQPGGFPQQPAYQPQPSFPGQQYPGFAAQQPAPQQPNPVLQQPGAFGAPPLPPQQPNPFGAPQDSGFQATVLQQPGGVQDNQQTILQSPGAYPPPQPGTYNPGGPAAPPQPNAPEPGAQRAGSEPTVYQPPSNPQGPQQ